MLTNDIARLSNELRVTLNTIVDDKEMVKLSHRFEELLSNYSVARKTVTELEEDLPEKIELFISAKKLEGYSPNTLEDYKIELNLFSNYCKKATVQITTPDIRSYLVSCKDVMQSTLGKKLFVLRSFFGWLVKEEYLLRNPTLRISPPKTPIRTNKGLSIEELEIVRESCDTLRKRAFLEVGYSTAARLSELSSMNISDIDFQDMSMSVIGKGNKERTVFISPKAMYHLNKYLESRDDNCDALFVTQRKPYRRMSNRAIQDEVRSIEEAASIKSRLTAHRLRHSFATLAMSQGIELADLQGILGHSNPSTTLIYSQVSESRKKQAHNRFHVQ